MAAITGGGRGLRSEMHCRFYLVNFEYCNDLPTAKSSASSLSVTNSPLSPTRAPHRLGVPAAPTQVQIPPLLSVFHRPLSLAPPQPCNTVGGCLFDRAMCTYVHPEDVPYANRFVRFKVGLSSFVRSRIPPGGSSVLETNTHMTEPHTVGR
ncbi:unnamed protein product [Strongylus vulgaris]|uniref:Uncharacterized protein n=1 Tax=Strongylus vulgaris TaxID=40348 RepID=A0A3P7KN66_STRVU|nr:unnamed protein product [Strongylus vulgaris]